MTSDLSLNMKNKFSADVYKRFSIYKLEDNDYFIKDYWCNTQFTHPKNKEDIINIFGIIILTTKSVIFVPSDSNLSVVKFHFKYFSEKPKVVLLLGKDYLKIKVKKVIEIPNDDKIYQIHNYSTEISILFTYERVESTLQILFELYNSYQNKELNYDMYSEEFLSTIYSFKFDYSKVKSLKETFLLKKEEFVNIIIPLIEMPGIVMLTDERIYIQPLYCINSEELVKNKILLRSIHTIYKRYYKTNFSALEIIYNSKSIYDNIMKTDKNESVFLVFKSSDKMTKIYDILINAVIEVKSKDESYLKDLDYEFSKPIQNNNVEVNKNSFVKTNFEISTFTKLWVEGTISNFEYLEYLNCAANRTKSDLTQYPIFPWILKDFNSPVLKINDETIYRDLTKPIGALNAERLKIFQERFKEMQEPKYLYGTHYSNPTYVVNYLVRNHPNWMLKLNGGRFDHPDRLFSSIQTDWKLCNESYTCVKELIPEFYEDNPSFLTNSNNINFGNTFENKKINVGYYN